MSCKKCDGQCDKCKKRCDKCEGDGKRLQSAKQFAIAWLCAAAVATFVIGMRYYTTLGTGYFVALMVTVVSIFLTAISLYVQSKVTAECIALVSILLAVIGWGDGAYRSQIAPMFEPTSAITVQVGSVASAQLAGEKAQ